MDHHQSPPHGFQQQHQCYLQESPGNQSHVHVHGNYQNSYNMQDTYNQQSQFSPNYQGII